MSDSTLGEKLKKNKAAIQKKIVNKDYYLKAFERLEKEKNIPGTGLLFYSLENG